jgi:hypothetical protein
MQHQQTMEFLKTLIHGKVLGTCPVCLENVREKHTHTPRCHHQLHKHCYRSLLEHSISRCPSCRADFNQPFSKTCQFCHLSIDIHESQSGILKSGDCDDCYFHYDCFKRESHAYCDSCSRPINSENVSALSYLYFQNGFEAWVGQLQPCRHEGCCYLGSPKRFGYCYSHNKQETMNKSIAKTLEFMVRYTNIQDQQLRYDTFYKVLSFIDQKYKFTDYELINLDKTEIRRNIAAMSSY